MIGSPEHILFDLDGTLADNSHRTSLAKQKRWDEYHAACDKDEPLHGALALMSLMLEANYEADGSYFFPSPIIVTGRSESARAKTIVWLKQHLGRQWVFMPHELVMRPEGDFSPNVAFKRNYIQSLHAKPDRILLIDDHPGALELSDVCRVLPIRSTW